MRKSNRRFASAISRSRRRRRGKRLRTAPKSGDGFVKGGGCGRFKGGRVSRPSRRTPREEITRKLWRSTTCGRTLERTNERTSERRQNDLRNKARRDTDAQKKADALARVSGERRRKRDSLGIENGAKNKKTTRRRGAPSKKRHSERVEKPLKK